MQRSKRHYYSVTSSAQASSVGGGAGRCVARVELSAKPGILIQSNDVPSDSQEQGGSHG
jgi:hypothetical protein